jgi:hypothetical protein
MKNYTYCYLFLFFISIVILAVSCNKEKRLLKCPDGYDCIDDKVKIGFLPAAADTTTGYPLFPPIRVDNDSIYNYYFYDPQYVNFSTRTVIGKYVSHPDANDEYKGTSICINNDAKRVQVNVVVKHARQLYGREGTLSIFYSIPKIPLDYVVSIDLTRY